MPTKQKSVKISKKPSRSKKVELAVSRSKLRSFRLVHHRHTGKIVHPRHTSHLALAFILAIVGMVIYISRDITQALPPPVSQDVTVSAVVPGAAPTVGATITSPTDGATMTYQPTVQISGTCAPQTFVIVSSNASIVGSTICTSAGIFVLQVQLSLGVNVLTAKNYDDLNQPGPDTPAVTVTIVDKEKQATSAAVNVRTESLVSPVLPTVLLTCDSYQAPTISRSGDVPRVAVVCMSRSFEPKKQYTLGVITWGGSPPYALNIDWGDGSENTLLSLTSYGYKTVPFQYDNPGLYTITLKLTDKDGKTAYVQTTVRVNGETKPFFAGLRDSFFRISWFETPIPLYSLAVALTLGFWLGDLFDRRFGITKAYKKTRRRTA
ncbi:MAG: hypothetical protein JWM00_613 [Candidatus Saccharibacteria bacterium]|nr:hypothetical protein [Candidatus Saccharibacteria bacterium]